MQALGGEGAGDCGYLRGRRGAEGVAVGEIQWAALGELRGPDMDPKGIRGTNCSGAVSCI